MIIIEFYRFLLDIDKVINHLMPYHSELDHSDIAREGDCDFTRATRCAKAWLKDHYGYSRISYCNPENFLCVQSNIISNRRKFTIFMKKQGIELIKLKDLRRVNT